MPRNQFGLRDIIDSPPEDSLMMNTNRNKTSHHQYTPQFIHPPADLSSSSNNNNNTTTNTGSTQQATNTSGTISDKVTGHRPGGTPQYLQNPNERDLLISPSTATDISGGNLKYQQQQQVNNKRASSSSPSPNKQRGRNDNTAPALSRYQHDMHSYLDNSNNNNSHQLHPSLMGTRPTKNYLQQPTAAVRADQINNATANLSAALDSDLVSSINTSQGGDLHFAQDFRQALSKAYFKIDAQEKIIAELRGTLDRERKVFSERHDSIHKQHQKQVESMEAEHKADRTFLVQAKHDRDRFDRQYHDLLELAEKREQEQQLEMNRWENERQSLSKRVDETSTNSKNMTQLLEAAQSRVRALEEQLADRDHRLQQLQAECSQTRNEVVGFEKKVREGLLVDARISQKWLSEADNAKRDNQALCASLLRAMNLLSRTVEYGPLLTKGSLGEGFVYCGADPNVNFGSTNIANATSNAAVLNSLVNDTNTLLRQSSVPPLASTAASTSFSSIFEGNNNGSGGNGNFSTASLLRAELLRCESDFWVPKSAYDLLGRLLGWMEQSCSLKITPQVEQNLLPALHEWFVVLNAVWRERTEQKTRAAVQQYSQKLDRDAEKRKNQQVAQPSRFNESNNRVVVESSGSKRGNNNNNSSEDCSSHHQCCHDNNEGSDGNNNKQKLQDRKCSPIQAWEVSIPSRRTSDRLKQRIDEAKRHAWNLHNSSSNSRNVNANSNKASSLEPSLQRWSSIALDAVQSILDLEKSLLAQQRETEKQRQSVLAANSAASSAVRLANQTSKNFIDTRDIEDGLRQAAGPVSLLQDLSEQLREHVEDFRDALNAANPENVVVSSTSNTEDERDGTTTHQKQHSNKKKQSSASGANEKVPLQLLMAVFNVSAEFCDEVDKSAIHLQKAQFDIDRAMSFFASQLSNNNSSVDGSEVTNEEVDDM